MKPRTRRADLHDEAVHGYLRMLLLVFGLIALAIFVAAIQNCSREKTDRSASTFPPGGPWGQFA